MFCPACGKEVPANGQFCIHCGVGQGQPRSASAPEPKAPGTHPEDGLQAVLSGRYELKGEIGRGDTSLVYRAREIALDRLVALKTLQHQFHLDREFVRRFRRQTQWAAQLEHPHIVRIYALGQDPELSYFTMDLVPGGSLEHRLKATGAQDPDDIARWGREICAALAYAHGREFVHRALKPGNILLDADGRAVVSDFGLARDDDQFPSTAKAIGPLPYMSPEQALGQGLNTQSDLYSLGVVLYELATGSRPFKAADPVGMAYQHVHEAPEPPDSRNPHVPPWLRVIILHCLAKDPARRYTAAALGQALADHGKPMSHRPGKGTRLSPASGSKGAKRSKVKTPKAAGPRRGRWILTICLGLLAVLGGVLLGRQIEHEQGRDSLAQMRRQVDVQQRQARQLLGQVQENQQDDAAYIEARKVGIQAAYEAYLAAYPQGRHAREALRQLKALGQQGEQSQGQLASQRQDSTAYSQARQQGTRDAYEGYVQDYPQGVYLPHALQALAALEAQQGDNRHLDTPPQKHAVAAAEAAPTVFRGPDQSTQSTAPAERPRAVPQARSGRLQNFWLTGTVPIEMVWIEPGSFARGSPSWETGRKDVEGPQYEVAISQGFWLGKYELTQEQWEAVQGHSPSFYRGRLRPVESVSWNDVEALLRRLNAVEGARIYRLPTEAEWEYACRAGSAGRWSFGDNERALAQYAWFDGNKTASGTQPVGTRRPNAWGLHDMHGNVREWCSDWYGSYSRAPLEDPSGPGTGLDRTHRGGGFNDSGLELRSASRNWNSPATRTPYLGVRLIRLK